MSCTPAGQAGCAAAAAQGRARARCGVSSSGGPNVVGACVHGHTGQASCGVCAPPAAQPGWCPAQPRTPARPGPCAAGAAAHGSRSAAPGVGRRGPGPATPPAAAQQEHASSCTGAACGRRMGAHTRFARGSSPRQPCGTQRARTGLPPGAASAQDLCASLKGGKGGAAGAGGGPG